MEAKENAKGIAGGFIQKVTRSLGVATGKGSGHVHLEVIGADGTVKEVRDCDNLYTDAGILSVVERTGGVDATAAFDYIAVGTSTQAAASGDTALIAEIVDSGLARAQDATPTTTGGDTLSINVTFSVTATKTLGEIGLLNAASTGDLLGRTVLSPTVPVVNTDTVNATYTFQQA